MGQMQLQGSASKLVHPPFRARVVSRRGEGKLSFRRACQSTAVLLLREGSFFSSLSIVRALRARVAEGVLAAMLHQTVVEGVLVGWYSTSHERVWWTRARAGRERPRASAAAGRKWRNKPPQAPARPSPALTNVNLFSFLDAGSICAVQVDVRRGRALLRFADVHDEALLARDRAAARARV